MISLSRYDTYARISDVSIKFWHSSEFDNED